MKKIWLDHYPPHVPSEIGEIPYSSIADFFIQQSQRYAEHTAVINFGVKLTYARLQQLATQFAAYLQQSLQLKPGDRLAIMLPNCLQYHVALFGALLAGVTVVNVNPLYKPRELVHQVNDAGVATIVVLANFAHIVAQALPETKLQRVIITELGDLFPQPKRTLVNLVVKYIKKMVPPYSIANAISFRSLLQEAEALTLQPVLTNLDDIAFLQYTGGTTGTPKGAMLSHRNLLSNTMQCYRWLEAYLKHGKETMVVALPLYHIFSLTVSCFISIQIGASSLLITNPRDLPTFIHDLKKQPFSVFIGVNTLFNLLLNHSDFNKLDFSHLKLTVAGGMSLQKQIAEQWQRLTSSEIIEGYGLTETSPVVTINPLQISEFKGSIGLPVPSTEIKVIDEAGHEVAQGEVGELCVKGPQIMVGYWQHPEETAKIMLDDEWLRTGDIVKVDEMGFVYIVDRKKDMVLVSGFNVYPNEIEATIAELPQVLEVAVIGVPDERTGEAVKAFVVKKDPALTEDDVRAYCAKYLTGYKQPKYIVFRDSLPKTPVGKILRRELRDH